MMQPDKKLIKIHDNERLITEFISDMIITPRKLAHKWSAITNQTPNLKTGYPSQHLASLTVGMKGTATGARGNDISDGSEVKACSKVARWTHAGIAEGESFLTQATFQTYA